MEVTFWGVRGSIPAPGPGTVRYGGNTSCVSVRLSRGALLILDVGTGARGLGLALLNAEFGQGRGRASLLLSHTHWDHIQGFPFFGPLYVPGNRFTVYGGAESASLLEGILEGQMAPHYFPVQALRNMGATITCMAIEESKPFDVEGCRITACANLHGRSMAWAFRLDDGGRSLVYAADAGYPDGGPTEQALSLYANTDLLIHDSTFTSIDKRQHASRGQSSVEDAVEIALRSRVKALALFHYDQDYTDTDVDRLADRARQLLDAEGGTEVALHAASEGLTISV